MQEGATPQDAEPLRRRLYAPGAVDADVTAYRRAAALEADASATSVTSAAEPQRAGRPVTATAEPARATAAAAVEPVPGSSAPASGAATATPAPDRRIAIPAPGTADAAAARSTGAPAPAGPAPERSAPASRLAGSAPPSAHPEAEPGSADGAGDPAEVEPSAGPRRRRLLLPAAVVAGLALLGVALLPRPGTGTDPAATPSTTSTAAAADPQDGNGLDRDADVPIGDAGVSIGDDEVLPADLDGRRSFVRRLDAGRSAGLLPWLDAHPDAGPDAVRRASSSAAVEHTGEGGATVVLDAPGAEGYDGGGRMTVLLVTDRGGSVVWTAAQLAIHGDRTVHVAPIGSAGGAQQAGVPKVRTLTFPAGRRPLRLVVQAPAGMRWGAAVVFTAPADDS